MCARSDGLRTSAQIRRWRSAILGGGGSSGTDLGAEAYDLNWPEHPDPPRFTVAARIHYPTPEGGVRWTSTGSFLTSEPNGTCWRQPSRACGRACVRHLQHRQLLHLDNNRNRGLSGSACPPPSAPAATAPVKLLRDCQLLVGVRHLQHRRRAGADRL